MDGRFRSPKTMEELCVERAVPKSVGILNILNYTLNRLLLDMCQAAGIKRNTAHRFRVTCASSLFNASVASKLIFNRTVNSITLSAEVEKVSRKVDMYTTPVCFGNFNN